MATTAAEISVLDPEYEGRPVRRSDLQLLSGTSGEKVSSVERPRPDDEISHFINIVVAAIGFLITSPLLVLVALAIKLTSRGPVFYKQTRIGLDRRWSKLPTHEDCRVHDLGGRPFTMYKFRTMVVSAEADTKEVWASPQDQRVTPVGRLLRVTRIDELPQLLNVLNGEMNIVGPRPERPTIFAELREAIPDYHMRQRVRPGITGWAQVNQSYDTSIDDVRRKVEFDLEYVRRRGALRGALTDLSIMVRTVPIMFLGRLGW
ncbi:MAG TPA: sugar transferase [Gemmatimonadaceae bacterium]|nr:sugar transferase [Gemmatimonadaceae bacterium]